MLQTLLITVLTTVGSAVLAIVIVSLRTTKNTTLRLAASTFIITFRSIPPVPLLLFTVFALPRLSLEYLNCHFPVGLEFYLLLICLSLNTSAYLAEIIRSGLKAVPSEQADAAQVLGLSPWCIRFRILYPQAIRIAMPNISSRLIHNMKNSSMALVLPLAVDNMEIVGQAGRIAGQTFTLVEPLLVAGGFHLLLATLLGCIFNYYAQKSQICMEVTS
jgi:polar amino acid transport system permease protein